MWELLEHAEVVEQLYHINNYADVVKSYKPRSVEQLAMILAIIRPGKKHLMGKSFDEIAQTVWDKPVSDEYYFKKAHAIAFATAIVVQLNLICENLSQPS
jgi:DNA polymerase III alpha subunit